MFAEDLTPDSRMLPGGSGTPVVLADGQTWLLRDGGLCNDLDELRDAIDDSARLTGEVELLQVAELAAQLLVANYDLAVDEVRTLLAGAVDQTLVDAVMLATFGPNDGRRTYTTWAASALLANGIDPDRVPSALRPHVLHQLEATKRCIPRSEYIESAEAARRLAGIRSRAIRPAPPETPSPEA